MTRIVLFAALSLGLCAPAFAQHADHAMPSMPAMPQKPAASAPASAPDQTAKPAQTIAPHEGHAMDSVVPPPEAGDGDAPETPTDFAADAFFPVADMAHARGVLDKEHGGGLQSKVMTNLFEYQSRSGEGGYRWDGEGWFGGDLNRLVVKSEGEGSASNVQSGEIQALYSRAIAPFTDFQVGVRHDFEPGPSRTFLTLGFESLLPYRLKAGAAVFVGERGQVLGRLEGSYDFRLTQRLVLQPRVELNLAAKNDAATGIGSGLSDAELGLRLRYEIRREFAPYLGVSFERSLGDTAGFARTSGERVEKTSLVAGIRAWF